MMRKEEKAKLVNEYREKFRKANAAFITGYQGIKVNDITDLRRTLRDAGVEFKVMKNTLATLAVKDTPAEALSKEFAGPVAVALSYGDASVAAKKLAKFEEDLPGFNLRTAVLGGTVLKVSDIRGLAKLPPRDVLAAKLLGVMKNVPRSLIAVLSGVPKKFVYALNAVKGAKEKAS
ncbi:MAG: 50S ribosomal protein L10 [Deltaproteobacteria bacterium]|nr:50S ribosomal protein L10 [Deltaproteobacteria bacterium]